MNLFDAVKRLNILKERYNNLIINGEDSVTVDLKTKITELEGELKACFGDYVKYIGISSEDTSRLLFNEVIGRIGTKEYILKSFVLSDLYDANSSLNPRVLRYVKSFGIDPKFFTKVNSPEVSEIKDFLSGALSCIYADNPQLAQDSRLAIIKNIIKYGMHSGTLSDFKMVEKKWLYPVIGVGTLFFNLLFIVLYFCVSIMMMKYMH